MALAEESQTFSFFLFMHVHQLPEVGDIAHAMRAVQVFVADQPGVRAAFWAKLWMLDCDRPRP